MNLEDYLASTARTIALHGVYKGVAAVQGDFRVDTPKTAIVGAPVRPKPGPAK